MKNNQQGFTLIELMVVIGILGILAALGITTFNFYKRAAAYNVAEQTISFARRSIEAALTKDPDNPPAAVPTTVQTAPGPIQSAAASEFLPSFQLPRNIRFQVEYTPACTSSACTTEVVEVRHCLGTEYVRWVRYGDGVDVLQEHLEGYGCNP